MSDEQIYGPTTTIYASQDGGVKWLLGAAAVAALVGGGGYVAAMNNAPGDDYTKLAYNNEYEPIRARPLPPLPVVAETAERVATPAAQRRRAPPVHRAPARAVAAAEETFGATDSDEILVTGARRPVWARMPSSRRLAALYPERARERGREGEARLACVVETGGALDCEGVEATPGGFGRAALRVARAFRHAPQLADGSDAAGTSVNLRIVFRMEEDEGRA